MRSPNRYINNHNFGPTQALYENLIVEAIRIHGVWVNYLPRNKVNFDDLFGESAMSTFEDSILIEAYWNNPASLEGARMMSKFGVELREEVKLTIAQRRFEEVRAEHLIEETGQNIEQELTNRYHAGQFNGILLEEGGIEGYYIDYDRPKEGDLIFVPQFQKLFEITYVQHDAIFYQGGSLQTWDLHCILFEYSHEELNTGNGTIDSIEDLFSGNVLNRNITEEDGLDVALEDEDGKMIEEGFEPSDADKQTDTFTNKTDGVVDFSEKSPFVKRDTNFRW